MILLHMWKIWSKKMTVLKAGNLFEYIWAFGFSSLISKIIPALCSAWLYKMWGNCILPGVFGVESRRYIEKIHHKNPIAKQLVKNVLKYNTNVRLFFNDGLLSDMKILATQMFFPTGQIEADGLSVISAEVWAATYLLLCAHKKMREADHHSIRSAYSSLAWDSSQVYRMTLIFYQTFHQFREKFLPLWQEIESLAGIQENSDFSAGDSGLSSRPSLSTSIKVNTSKGKPCKKSRIKGNPSPLPELRISDDLEMQHSLQLKIIPEKKSAFVSEEDCAERNFSDLNYAKQVDIIKQLLATPGKIIQCAPITLKLMEPKLLNATYARKSKTTDNPEDFPLLRAVKILTETLKLLFKEVKITPTLRFDISENIRATAEDIHSFFAYTEWVLNKFSEFHSMLELCYNFAVLSFDLELPSFEKVSMHEKLTEENVKFSVSSIEYFENEQLEVKVVSLTKLMLEASFVSIQKQGGVDDDFDWSDFYKTDYHSILQRLPLRLGFNLLQFS